MHGGHVSGVRARCNSSPPTVIWLGPSCHLCAAVARPSLAGYRLETSPPPPPRPPHATREPDLVTPPLCTATLKRIRFSRCENDAFLPRALPALPATTPRRGRLAGPRRSSHYIFTVLPHPFLSTDGWLPSHIHHAIPLKSYILFFYFLFF